ncbi:SDR family oxidoreductase [Treponema sp. OMZ 840]|uniref:SDR family NAD(P)-dependent oxidoreductase n=1 Tax=Treponema sp. OMZ 840 TaxID=244313 RepID=UPI003D934845
MESIAGKTALIVGGSGGIGAAVALKLADAGCNMIVHGASESDKFNTLIDTAAEKVRVTKIVQRLKTDFPANFEQTKLYESALCADIICVCFGPFVQKDLHKTESEDWMRAASLNYVLPGVLVSAALPAMMQRRWGRFLLTGGTRTERVQAFRTNAAYAGAKTALASLIRSTAVFYAAYGITCNGIFPGFTQTEYVPPVEQKKLAQKMPQQRLVRVEEVAESAVFLLRQPMINGALLNIDGGWEPFYENSL